jgi:uncharacterized membrane protein
MTSRGMKIVLAMSIVFNVFVVGAAVGGAYRWFSVGQESRNSRPQQRGLQFAASGLSPAQQMAFRTALREVRRGSGALIDTARNGRTETVQTLIAPRFDKEAVSAALTRTRDADFAFRKRIEDTIVDFAQTLSPDDREKFVIGLQERGPLRRAAAPAVKK